jgi:Peptidase family M20/M25/M40
VLEARRLTVRFLRVEGGPPAVLGELRVPGARATIGVYAHYDGQPADPAQWVSPPFSPAVRDQQGRDIDWRSAANLDANWRIYARSASDDKAPIQATMSALDALRASGIHPSVNLKFLFEGEEEAGSTHLAELLKQHPVACIRREDASTSAQRVSSLRSKPLQCFLATRPTCARGWPLGAQVGLPRYHVKKNRLLGPTRRGMVPESSNVALNPGLPWVTIQ